MNPNVESVGSKQSKDPQSQREFIIQGDAVK
jgi:hypothetical protein